MSSREETYVTFMMDHAAGQHGPAVSLAADLHVLLSDQGALTNDVWSAAANHLRAPDNNIIPAERIDRACEIIAEGYDHIKWRRGLSGAHYSKSDVSGGKFMRLLPGKSVPTHGHKRLEITVVLDGQLSDGIGGLYDTGDIAFGIPGERHKPAAHGDRPCICFVAKAERI